MFGSKRRRLKEKKENIQGEFSQGERERTRKWTKVFREGNKFHQEEVGKYLVKEKIQGNIYSSLFQSAGF